MDDDARAKQLIREAAAALREELARGWTTRGSGWKPVKGAQPRRSGPREHGWYVDLARPTRGGGWLTMYLETWRAGPGTYDLGCFLCADKRRALAIGHQLGEMRGARVEEFSAARDHDDRGDRLSESERHKIRRGVPFLDLDCEDGGNFVGSYVVFDVLRARRALRLDEVARGARQLMCAAERAYASRVRRSVATVADVARVKFYRRLARPLQTEFTQNLIAEFGACVVTGEQSRLVLQGAHIVAKSEGGSDTAAHNGLLLRADLHLLFDRGAMWIGDDSKVHVRADLLEGGDYAALEGRAIAKRLLGEERRSLLRRHRMRWKR